MKVALDARVMAAAGTGIAVYTAELVEQFQKLSLETQQPGCANSAARRGELVGDGPAFEFTFFRGNVRPNNSLPYKLANNFWEQFILPVRLAVQNIDIFHSPKNMGLPLYAPKGCRLIVTVHDLIPLVFPETYLASPAKRRLYLGRNRVVAQKADRIITDSEASKADIVKRLGVSEEKVRIVYLAAGRGFRPAQNLDSIAKVRKKYSIPGKYILGIGGSEPRKNVGTLIRAFQLFMGEAGDLPGLAQRGASDSNGIFLVIIGDKWHSSELDKATLPPNVVVTGFVPEEDMVALYQGAEVFVYPSLYEGFGLPVLEAMACGTPVITSNVSSLPEVAGEAAIMTNPCDIGEIAGAIGRVVSNDSLLTELSRKGLRRAAGFSWEKTARETLSVYEEVMGKNENRN